MLCKACATCWATDGLRGVTSDGVKDKGAVRADGVPIINDEGDEGDVELDVGARASAAANGDNFGFES